MRKARFTEEQIQRQAESVLAGTASFLPLAQAVHAPPALRPLGFSRYRRRTAVRRR